MKEWMTPKEASTFERMNGRLQLLFSNRITQHFKEYGQLQVVFWKNILPLKQLDTLNKSKDALKNGSALKEK